jgi:hypothetical protein
MANESLRMYKFINQGFGLTLPPPPPPPPKPLEFKIQNHHNHEHPWLIRELEMKGKTLLNLKSLILKQWITKKILNTSLLK